MKILVLINHFYGKNPYFVGRSSQIDGKDEAKSKRKAERRLAHIKATVDSLNTLGKKVDIKFCGYQGKSLVKLDFDFEKEIEKPTDIMYASLAKMGEFVNRYDYFINIEDDILLSKETFDRIVAFDKNSNVNEILHPNRMESDDQGNLFCIDLKCVPGWTYTQKIIFGKEFRQAVNPHSGLAIFSKEKLKYALKNSDLKSKTIVLSKGMESAYASVHSPFILWRAYDEVGFHSVFHQDKWVQPKKDLLTSITWRDFVPLIVLKLLKYAILTLQRKE
ncbi:hypothetical protein [Leptospira kmetyi]|uniref:hypothetical protein n=1 Tax=Leptospira kmetyi TaxID=408139 RepID=UPI001083B6A1|nr:hypothetical protein [Leptospira kmetyi]TGK21394.1 hypothetical protein EHO62_02985 [Leptospira kmetyi]TGK28321.1 hypothetical protein EHO66_12465 [Leptospira kmetyi]TGL68312.1 hypothetical protein EHQ67_14100 [Leptospira kmetyi]